MGLLDFLGGRSQRGQGGGRRRRRLLLGKKNTNEAVTTTTKEAQERATVLPEPATDGGNNKNNNKNKNTVVEVERPEATNSTEGDSAHNRADADEVVVTVREIALDNDTTTATTTTASTNNTNNNRDQRRRRGGQQERPSSSSRRQVEGQVENEDDDHDDEESSPDLEGMEDRSFEIVPAPETTTTRPAVTVNTNTGINSDDGDGDDDDGGSPKMQGEREGDDKNVDETEILQKFKAKSPSRGGGGTSVAQRAAWLENSAFKREDHGRKASSAATASSAAAVGEISPQFRENARAQKKFWQGKAFQKETSNAPDLPALRKKTDVQAKKKWLETVAFTPSGGGNMAQANNDDDVDESSSPEKRKHTIHLLPSSPQPTKSDDGENEAIQHTKDLLGIIASYEEPKIQTDIFLNKKNDEMEWAYELWFRKGLLPWRTSTFAVGPAAVVFESMRELRSSSISSPSSSKENSPIRFKVDSPASTASSSSAIKALMATPALGRINHVDKDKAITESGEETVEPAGTEESDRETEIVSNLAMAAEKESPEAPSSDDPQSESTALILNKSGDEHEWAYSVWSQEGLLPWRPAQTDCEVSSAPVSLQDAPLASKSTVASSIDEASVKGVVNLDTKASMAASKDTEEAIDFDSSPTNALKDAVGENAGAAHVTPPSKRDSAPEFAIFNPFEQSTSMDSSVDPNTLGTWDQNGSLEWKGSDGGGSPKANNNNLSLEKFVEKFVDKPEDGSSLDKQPSDADAANMPDAVPLVNSDTATGTDTQTTIETMETTEAAQPLAVVTSPAEEKVVSLEEIPSRDLSDGHGNASAPMLPVGPTSNIVSSDCSVQSNESGNSQNLGATRTIPSAQEDLWKSSSAALDAEGELGAINHTEGTEAPESLGTSGEIGSEVPEKLSIFERQQMILAKMQHDKDSVTHEAIESADNSGSIDGDGDGDENLSIYLLQQSILEKLRNEPDGAAQSTEYDASPSETTPVHGNAAPPRDPSKEAALLGDDHDPTDNSTDSFRVLKEQARKYLGSEYTSDSYEVLSTDGESGVQLEPSVVTHASSITVEDISELHLDHVFDDDTKNSSRDVAASFELMDEMQFQSELNQSPRSRGAVSPARASQRHRADIDRMIALLEAEDRAAFEASKKDQAPAQPSRKVSMNRDGFGLPTAISPVDQAPSQPSRKASVEGAGLVPVGPVHEQALVDAQGGAAVHKAEDQAPAQPMRKVSVEGLGLAPTQKWIDSIKQDSPPISPVRVASVENMNLQQTPESIRKARAKKAAAAQRAKYVIWLTKSRSINYRRTASAPMLTWFAKKLDPKTKLSEEDMITFLFPFLSVPPWKASAFRVAQRIARSEAPRIGPATAVKKTLSNVQEAPEDEEMDMEKSTPMMFGRLPKDGRNYFPPLRTKAESEGLARLASAKKFKFNHMRRGFGKTKSQKRIVCL